MFRQVALSVAPAAVDTGLVASVGPDAVTVTVLLIASFLNVLFEKRRTS
jgi:hypothetical protein